MIDYTKVKSEFIKKEIKKTRWGKREYINDLIEIEKFAKGEMYGLMTGIRRSALKGEYPKEWKKIWLEINPTQYKKDIEWEEKERKKEEEEEMKFQEEEKKELIKEKASWKKAGGKL